MRQMSLFETSTQEGPARAVIQPRSGYLPLMKYFISAYLEALLEYKKTDVDSYVEFSAICEVSRKQGFITQSQCFDYTAKFRAKRYFPGFREKSIYAQFLRRIYTMVYTECIECADLWRAIAAEVDNAYPRLSTQEYSKLCDRLAEHEVEIENAVLVKHAAQDKLEKNVHRVDYVSYEALYREAAEIEGLPFLETRKARQFLFHKVSKAKEHDIITAGERQEILNQIRLC